MKIPWEGFAGEDHQHQDPGERAEVLAAFQDPFGELALPVILPAALTMPTLAASEHNVLPVAGVTPD